MSSSWKKLAEANFSVLLRRADGKFLMELVDVNLVPMVRVARLDIKGSTFSVPLDKLSCFYSDDTGKVYSEDTGEEVTAGDLHDMAVEAYFEKQSVDNSNFAGEEGYDPAKPRCDRCKGPIEEPPHPTSGYVDAFCGKCKPESPENTYDKKASDDEGRHVCKGDKCKNWNIPGSDYCVTCTPKKQGSSRKCDGCGGEIKDKINWKEPPKPGNLFRGPNEPNPAGPGVGLCDQCATKKQADADPNYPDDTEYREPAGPVKDPVDPYAAESFADANPDKNLPSGHEQMTDAQKQSYQRLVERYGRKPDKEGLDALEGYYWVTYDGLFIGIEKDGYAHS